MKRLLSLLLLVPLLALGQVITNPSVTGVPQNLATAGVARIIGRSAIPFVGLGSCTMSAAGALSACTALPVAYASAYCYLPANAAATSIAAGWYYCTFSSTTAGTVYLNTYTSGVPTIPTSLTAVTTGSSFTGDTGAEIGPTITLPANSMGPNGAVRIGSSFSFNTTANNKTIAQLFGANTIVVEVPASVARGALWSVVTNRGVTGSQLATSNGAAGSVLDHPADLYIANDTTTALTIRFSMTRVTATDNAILESYLIELLSDGT